MRLQQDHGLVTERHQRGDSLGRRDGLIEYVRRDDTPTDRILTGRAAAVVKELVCRGAVIAPMRLSRFYRGLEGPRER